MTSFIKRSSEACWTWGSLNRILSNRTLLGGFEIMQPFRVVILSLLLVQTAIVSGETYHFGFEPGDTPVPYSGEPGAIRQLQPTNSNDPMISTDFARAGTHSVKNYIHRTQSRVSFRTESIHPRNVLDMDHNRGAQTRDYWIGLSVYIPSPYPAVFDNGNQSIFQLHNAPPKGADWSWETNAQPIAIQLRPTSDTGGMLKVMIGGGGEVGFLSSKPVRNYSLINNSVVPYKTDEWIDLVFNFRIAQSPHGFFKLWVNGKQVVNHVNTSVDHDGNGDPYVLFGMYIGWRDKTIDEPVLTRLVYHDEYRIAWGDSASYDTVRPGIGTPGAQLLPPGELRVIQ